MNNNETAVIYCRVSTKKQEEEWTSLLAQEKHCLNYCNQNKIKYIQVYKETFTGTTLNRPIFQEAINNAIKNKVRYFIVFDIDRLTRQWYWAYSKIKKELYENWVLLRDSKGTIIDEEIVEKNSIFDMGKYDWNRQSNSQIIEVLNSTSAQTERNKILQRTIPREIELEQSWYHVKPPIFWFMNKKVKDNEKWSKTIQIRDPIEWLWIEQIYNKVAEWIKDKYIISKELNEMWYKTRKGVCLSPKKIDTIIRNPIYAWIIWTKWTGKPIKAKYDGLVSIDLWNKANKNKFKIIEKNNWEIDLIDLKKQNQWNEVLEIKRKKFDINLPFRNLIKSSVIKWKFISWSFAKKKFWYYHPIREKWVVWENIKKSEFEWYILGIFNDISLSKDIFDVFFDRFEYIYEENKKELTIHIDRLKYNLSSVDKKIKEYEEQIPDIIKYKEVLERVNNDLVNLKIEKDKILHSIEEENNKNFNDVWKYKEFCNYILEHLEDLLNDSKTFEEIDTLFKFIFKKTPEYNEIINRTFDIWPTLALGFKKEHSVFECSTTNHIWYPQRESNPHLPLRRGLFYPLNYEDKN